MRYNELTYHKANPFFKQGYLPDRAWYNRKPKQFPSQIPTGNEYFTQSGRKHYQGRFNHSEIQHQGVLTSPEKYPYQNRIALEKTYMRSLDTTDIEGAGSGTRVNEAVRNKLRAQEQLARKHNQSLDLREHKEHQYQQKRRQLAIRQYETLQTKKSRIAVNGQSNSSPIRNPEVKEPQLSRTPYNSNETIEYPQYEQYGDPYIKLPQKNLQTGIKQFQSGSYLEHQPQSQSISASHQPQSPVSLVPPESSPPQSSSGTGNRGYLFNANDRHQSNPSYINHYDSELQRRKEDYKKTIEMDSVARAKLMEKNSFRKYTPTNLSFNLAGQNIVGGRQ